MHIPAVSSRMKHSNLSILKRYRIILRGISLTALVIKIEAITGIGINEKYGRQKVTIKRTIIPFKNWLIFDVAPLATFTTVLTRTPVHGVAPRIPQTTFANDNPKTS